MDQDEAHVDLIEVELNLLFGPWRQNPTCVTNSRRTRNIKL